ncbi:MAG: AAA family ATPase [Caulobacteraceae bacterium]|nr:AAA family ATPase [Caulobacteraceae bacterium]
MEKNIERRRRTKSGEAAPPPSDTKPTKRYNTRGSSKTDAVRWVDDDTLQITEKAAAPPAPEDEKIIHGISLPKEVPVSVKIHIHANSNTEDEYDDEDSDEDDSDYDDEDEEEDDRYNRRDRKDEEMITQLLARSFGASYGRKRSSEPPILFVTSREDRDDEERETPIPLTVKERRYLDSLSKTKYTRALKQMKSVVKHLGDTDIPFKFQILDLDTTDTIRALLIHKVETINRMGHESGESQKLRVWVETMLKVPFGKIVPLPVTMKDPVEKCAEFLTEARKKLDKATYGMEPVKMQILQIVAQWISNPESMGNCIAMQGAAGVGKTSFARNGIASVLGRPFMFFSLGGASDISHYIGHSYTYEGSTCGRIVDAIIQSKCMNPVLYFDELDKISGTPHGEEITSMLIHLTDRSQNCQFHDRYFAGVDFDLSKCLFVFSYNDESKINPILKNRMTIIQCQGYKDHEKKIIVANYIWPEILQRVGIKYGELGATEAAAEHIIRTYSKDETGMRSLIRVVETVVSRINLIRISDKEVASKYKFYVPIVFPMVIDVPTIDKLLIDYQPKEPERWRDMYA